MTPSPPTLRRQLLLWLTVPLSALWLISSTIDYNVAMEAANHAYDQSLLSKLIGLVKQVVVENGQLVVKLPPEAVAILRSSDQDKIYFQVQDAHNQFIFGYIDLPMPMSAITQGVPFYRDETYRGGNVRIISLNTQIEGRNVLIQLARTTNKREETIAEMLVSMIIPQIVLVLMAMLSVWYAVGRSLTPLMQIRDEIIHRSHLDLSPVSHANVPLEIQPLIQGFNELIARLSGLLNAQQRFVADAAHQLRTPLAGLKAQTELALRLENPVEIHHSLQQMHTAAKQANHLIQQLLVLARAEPDAQQESLMRSFDLAELAKKITMTWIPRALHKKIDLGFEGDDSSATVHGNATLIGELLNNLIDNALRYTPENGVVTVRIVSQLDDLILEVEDNGTGIPIEMHDLVFNRFFRILGSNQEGCGLGLAIVREIANGHDTDVQLLSGGNNQGTLMRVPFKRIKSEFNPLNTQTLKQ
ncbi:MAG: sensor histidine kinase N-terminal domain-containing protein [Gallionella sp.]|nr:sensor histidine kinase N-terminal domain-containing protein [Gallionella sp.]MDD4957882.1 sensor histidine kinase N-terminal domain-containing protein [Gallionella sp.]